MATFHFFEILMKKHTLFFPGYYGGAGIWQGLGKGLAGAVGIPVSGALGFVSLLSTGLARATGTCHFYLAVHKMLHDQVEASVVCVL